MKAIFFKAHGGPEVLNYGDLPDPVLSPGEALIKVRAVALNHLDIWVRRGWRGLNLPMPHITGSDIVGEIVSTHGSSNWQPGTRVIINPGVVTSDDEWTRRGEDSVSPGYQIIGEHRRGGLAEYVAVPLANMFKVPNELSDEDAAAPLLVGLTCWRMLFKRGSLRAGESVLVVGAGGGVNSLAISLARAAGATVYAIAGSDEKAAKARALGAEDVINYNKVSNWSVELLRITKGRGVDLVVDNVGAKTFPHSVRAAARGGRIVTVGNTSGYEVALDNRLIFAKQLSLIGSTMGSRQDFIEMTDFIWRHKIRAAIDQIAPLKEGIAMLRRLEEGVQFGKIVLCNV